jgi:hypothetical protein
MKMTENNNSNSPFVQNLIDLGSNVIISMHNNNKDAALTLLKSMVSNINNYHTESKFAIQYDIYNYMKNISKTKSRPMFRPSLSDSTGSYKLIIPSQRSLKTPTQRVLKDMISAEAYVNELINYTKQFEKSMCEYRNNFIKTNYSNMKDAVNFINKKLSDKAAADAELQKYVKKLVPVVV